MQCDYFDAGACRSCTWMGRPYADQLAAVHAAAVAALGRHPGLVWEEPVARAEEGFRNKAKMVVGGTVEQPTLGILDRAGHGVDLRHCGLHEPALHDALPVLAALVTRAGLVPYDVPTRRGELKHVLATVAPDGALMVRFVLRSTESLPRLRKHLPWLHEQLPGLVVASVNLQPEHKAVLEGPEEVLLTEQSTLPLRLAGLDLRLRPQGFFQTNTAVAAALYAEAAAWTRDLGARSAWDLYCGVGGFALTLAGAGVPDVVGVELSAEAVTAARESADRAGLDGVRFEAGDATAWAAAQEHAPDLVVVNPPRRGIGADLAARLDGADARHVLYSSCHSGSLARDLDAMPSWEPVRGRVFDMFPQTAHHEVLVLLRRR
ncbi:23S rRNA (uracil(747)-C(5))-methyltransferase RlmC [Nocardioides sp. AX2bis]|uniref:23S rRNA (uracil(747)-C(5))-methyltransferase RlmC n=1 Tax=Nocardioides sp. AX2bis TaxID=2653157 RepID=UPI0012EF21AF|nr:23S rRNA (uracil(747)-C(5))-methyltransferase RlmC [Nocardioides sp. AX2bis]VXC09028.1 23S rRNA (uracil(747)-C(5))-methyltransferase RlmC [Nocardioides sp. AX2bis]